jgi:lysozyme
MQISPAGLALIKRFERLRLSAYDDGYGNRTIGWGHLIQPGENYQTITAAQADELLALDLATAERAVNSLVRVPLTQSQYDALVSLVYNWGAGNFRNSSHLSLVNSGDYAGTAARLRAHPITSGGVASQGLVNRRAAEADLFARDGIYSLAEMGGASPAPTTPTTPTTPTDPTDAEPGKSWVYPAVAIGAALLVITLIND